MTSERGPAVVGGADHHRRRLLRAAHALGEIDRDELEAELEATESPAPPADTVGEPKGSAVEAASTATLDIAAVGGLVGRS